MPKVMTGKRPPTSKERGVEHTFDRNGALVVNPSALLASKSFLGQIAAAVKLGRYQERVRAKAAAKK